MTLVSEFWVLCLGRFIYGVSVGSFSVFCPLFIAEISPIEVKGPAGAFSQISVTFGILLAFTIGLGIGDVDQDEIDSFEIQQYWYIIFTIPLAIAFFQVLLLVCAFPYDTPVVLKQKGQEAELKAFMNKIYTEEATANERIEQIVVEEGEDDDSGPSYGAICCDPRYRRATGVGITLAIFSQLTGINVIMFYSNILFKGLSLSNTMITALIGIVNFITPIFGLLFLMCFGRKTLMLTFNIGMTIVLLLLALFAFEGESIGMISCVLLFIAFFEFSSGTIIWLYLAEIMQAKAIGIATFLNWTVNLAVSICVPYAVRAFHIGYIFLVLGVFTSIGTLIILFFMVETKGKTQAEINAAFNDDKDNEE